MPKKYITLCNACKKAVTIQTLIDDIVGKSSEGRNTLSRSGNDCKINISANQAINRGNEHIHLSCRFVRDTVERKKVCLDYVTGPEMIFYMLVKPSWCIILETSRLFWRLFSGEKKN